MSSIYVLANYVHKIYAKFIFYLNHQNWMKISEKTLSLLP